MIGLREAASFEGLIVLAVIYFVLNLLQKAGQKAAQSRRSAPPPTPEQDTPTQQESLSLQRILREIERVEEQKRQPSAPAPAKRPLPPPRQPPKPAQSRQLPAGRKPPPRRPEVTQDARGPMGRKGRMELASAEEVEERTSLEGGSLEQEESLENFDDIHRRRAVVDQDDQAEAVVRRRIAAAEARNQELRAADHQAFDTRIRQAPASQELAHRLTASRLREAFIWREILGPPKALE